MASTGEAWRLGRRPALDGLRGLAVLLVVADHAGFLSEPTGSIGVTVFFVLSGFLITRVIVEASADGRWSFAEFFGNRVARLLPSLVAMVAIVSALWLAGGADPMLVAERAARSLFYVQNFFMTTDAGTPFRHTWSLAVEEQFYLAWPFVLPWVLRSRRPKAALSAMVAASLTLRFALYGAGLHELACTSLMGNAAELLLGCGLAVFAASLPTNRWLMSAGAIGLAGVLAVSPSLDAPFLVPPIAGAACSALLVCGALSGNRVLECAPLRFTGRISYALYLWHFPLLGILGFVGVAPAATVGLTFALAAASTLWLEEPVRRRWRHGSLRAKLLKPRLLLEVEGSNVKSRVGGCQVDGAARESAKPKGHVAARQVA